VAVVVVAAADSAAAATAARLMHWQSLLMWQSFWIVSTDWQWEEREGESMGKLEKKSKNEIDTQSTSAVEVDN